MSDSEDIATGVHESGALNQNLSDHSDTSHEPIQKRGLDAFYDVPVRVSVVLGQALLSIQELMKIGRGAVIQLDRKVGEPVDVYVNNKLVARGELVKKNDTLGITMTEMVQSDARL